MKASILAAAAALLVTTAAQAHTHLEKAVPADNAVLDATPPQLSLEFSKVARLTAVTVQREGDQEPTKISVQPQPLATKQSVPLSPLSPGKYLVNWRVVGEDNHVMSGKLHFTIKAKTQ